MNVMYIYIAISKCLLFVKTPPPPPPAAAACTLRVILASGNEGKGFGSLSYHSNPTCAFLFIKHVPHHVSNEVRRYTRQSKARRRSWQRRLRNHTHIIIYLSGIMHLALSSFYSIKYSIYIRSSASSISPTISATYLHSTLLFVNFRT